VGKVKRSEGALLCTGNKDGIYPRQGDEMTNDPGNTATANVDIYNSRDELVISSGQTVEVFPACSGCSYVETPTGNVIVVNNENLDVTE